MFPALASREECNQEEEWGGGGGGDEWLLKFTTDRSPGSSYHVILIQVLVNWILALRLHLLLALQLGLLLQWWW